MSTARSSLVLMVGRVGGSAITYGASVLIARHLGPESWGVYTFVFGLAGIFGVIFDLQVTRLVVAHLQSRDGDPGEVVGSYLLLRTLLAAVAVAGVVAVAFLGDYGPGTGTAALVGASTLLFSAPWNALFVWFQTEGRYGPVVVANLAARVVIVGLIVALVAADVRSVAVLLVPGVLLEVIVLVSLLAVLRRSDVRLRLRFWPERWRAWGKETLPVAIGTTIALVYYRVDIVMLTTIDGFEAAGLYGVGYRFSEFLQYAPVAVITPVFPLLVSGATTDPEGFGRRVRALFSILVAVAVLCTAGFATFRHEIVTLIYGRDYDRAANSAALVMAGEALGFITFLVLQVLVATARNRAYPLVALLGLGINLALNLYLIERFSFTGAAVATLVTEVVVVAVMLRLLVAVPGVGGLPIAPVVRCLVAGGLLVGVGLGLGLVVPWPVAGVAALAVFVLVLQMGGLQDGRSVLELVRSAGVGGDEDDRDEDDGPQPEAVAQQARSSLDPPAGQLP